MRARWRRALIGTGGALVLLPLAGWLAIAHDPLAPGYTGPRPLAPAVVDRFAYPEAGTRPTVVFEREDALEDGTPGRLVQVEVTTPGDTAPHLVQMLYFPSPAPGRRPAVVVTPILGGSNVVATMMATALAEHGVHAAVVLRAESYLDSAASVERLERVLRTAVIDRRRAVDFLSTLPEVDPARIGAFGVSMGGIVSACFAAAEPRVKATMLVMAGGDVPDIILRSNEPRLRRYVTEMGARGLSGPALEEAMRAALTTDPLLLAPAIDARRVLFVAARFDQAVPPRNQERLWEALGRPERDVLPTGHYSAALYLPWIRARALAFFAERL